MPIIVKRNDFAKAPAAVDAILDGIFARHGEALAETARQLVPVRTGALRASIRLVPPEPGPRKLAVVTAFGDEASGNSYAAYVEFGTIRMAARPFLTPAYEQEVPKLLRDLQNLEPQLTVIGAVSRV